MILENGFTNVYLVGSLIQSAKEEFTPAKHFFKKEELAEYLKAHPVKNATILIKASRGIGLETIAEVL